MTDEVREVAKRLFDRLNREDKEAVATVGVGKANTGKEVLIAYCNPEKVVPVPELFEGYVVLKSTARRSGVG